MLRAVSLSIEHSWALDKTEISILQKLFSCWSLNWPNVVQVFWNFSNMSFKRNKKKIISWQILWLLSQIEGFFIIFLATKKNQFCSKRKNLLSAKLCKCSIILIDVKSNAFKKKLYLLIPFVFIFRQLFFICKWMEQKKISKKIFSCCGNKPHKRNWIFRVNFYLISASLSHNNWSLDLYLICSFFIIFYWDNK